MSLSRRRLLAAAAPLALAGCSGSFQSGVTTFANKLYIDVNKIAAYLEKLAQQVIAKTITAAQAAQAFLAASAEYFVPACRIFVSLVKLAGQVAAANPSLGGNATFQTALGQANTLTQNVDIQAAANSGTIPSDPVTVITGVIQLISQIMALTSGKVSPTGAAATV